MSRKHEEATTSEMRHDWLADRWVIIAPQRTERPHDFVRAPATVADTTGCPFCYGHESQTPAEVASYGIKCKSMGCETSAVPHWHVRVVPNKFPAVRAAVATAVASAISLEAMTQARGSSLVAEEGARGGGGLHRCNGAAPQAGTPHTGTQRTGTQRTSGVNLFRRRDLIGGHEVIVESPLHLQSISQLDRETTSLVFRAYRDRLAHWLDECGLKYAVVFKNVGQDAGASLSHTHSQVIATDILPTDVERMAKRMRLFADNESECLFCRMQQDELEQGSRVVEQTQDFLAFCPFASRLPSLVTILPKTHQSAFEFLNAPQLDQLSWLTHRLVRRIEKCYPDAAYNFIIHTAPRPTNGMAAGLTEAYHWRIELFPRLTTVAGFEWGSDCYINPIAPETAAASLRKAGV